MGEANFYYFTCLKKDLRRGKEKKVIDGMKPKLHCSKNCRSIFN